MTELLHNLSYQALNFENTKVNIKFDQIIRLNKNLKSLIRDVDRSTINTITLEDTIVDESKDRIELMEEELVNNVLSGKKIEIPVDFQPPMPDSTIKIQSDAEKAKAVKRKTDKSLNQVYETITKDVVTKARNDLVKSVSDYDGEIPTEVINNITSSFKQNDLVNKSVRKHVRDSIKDRNQQYFKQRKPPSIVKRNTKTTTTSKPQIKITDLVNRNISRSSSFSSIPLNEVEMISRSGSLDSISTMKREYSDQEMISRPPSVSSIRDFNKSNINLSFEQPFASPPKPIEVIEKNKRQKETLLTPPKSKVETPKITDQLPPKVTPEVVVKKKTSLTPAARAVIAKREEKEKGKMKPTVVTTPSAVDVLKKIKKKREVKKIKDPPTVSLVNSIEKKSTIKKKTAAAKADSKIKREELVAKWQNKSDDVEMAVPLQTGKRKKAIPKFNSTGDAKYKKEN